MKIFKTFLHVSYSSKLLITLHSKNRFKVFKMTKIRKLCIDEKKSDFEMQHAV